jgi:60 kDa SS-A/Ro ribonucleoprotein
MSKFNTAATPKNRTTNLAGGEAFKQSPELELVSFLLTTFLKDKFYEKEKEQLERLQDLIKNVTPEFAAKALVFARTKYGMRSVSHVGASELAKRLRSLPWAAKFFEAVIHRPDDILEILSYHTSTNGKISNSMKRGLAAAFDKFDTYQLAKYKGEGKGWKLIDAVNMLHPTPTERNSEGLKLLTKGELASAGTWESELSKAGQVSGESEKITAKAAVWVELIESRKLGYFALLRNLRNIIEQAPEAIDKALEMLVDERLIKKSLVLPFRFTTAYDEIEKLTDGKITRKVLVALNKAIDTAVSNVPELDGDNAIVLDVSSSMNGKPSQIGSLFAAVLLKATNGDFMQFDSTAWYKNYNPTDSTMTLAKGLRFSGGATNFHSIFQTLNKPYKRIIILSDMQAWVGHDAPTFSLAAYKKATGANPFIYSFDLNGYGTLQFPESNVFAMAGFSEKVFDTMKFLEADKKALVNEINKVEL